ncbi:TetR/AcrR family transcriptional regulator [Lactovum odontotermitis]
MENDNTKEQLIQATMRLLSENKDASRLTARKIAAAAEVNLAMINYYFGSKDALVSDAVGRLMAEQADRLREIRDSEVPARDKLLEFLVTMSDLTLDFRELTRPTVPYLLLEAELDLPYFILPMVKLCFDDKKTEAESRMIAFQIITFSQLVFYRSDDYQKLTGIDIEDKKQRDAMYQSLLDIYFGG